MNARAWWKSLSFKYQVFLYMAAAIVATALVVEIVVEPLFEGNFDPFGADIDWHEVPIWGLCAIAQGVLSSAIITRAIMRKLDRLAHAADEIAMGNLAVRVAEGGHPEDVFARLSRRFNHMAETIDTLLTNERRLLSDISHELRSPLARISASVELLAMKNEGNGNAAHLSRIENELAHMSHLIGVLLEQNRNRLSIREGRRAVDVSSLAREVADNCRIQGVAERKQVVADIDADVVVEGHPMQLRLILENILGNAIFYTPPGAGVEMVLARDGDMVRLEVRDHGPGVPEGLLADIFKPFFRVDPSRDRNSGGVGLGLTLVSEACEALGGRVEARNENPGLVVSAALPLARTPARTGEGI